LRSRTAAATPFRLISAASTNATSLKGSAGVLFAVYAVNLNAAIRYLKFYNKASAPTVGSDTPVLTLPIPASATGAGFLFVFDSGWAFCDRHRLRDHHRHRRCRQYRGRARTKSSSTARTSKPVAYGGLRTFGAPVAIDAVQRGVGWRGLTGTAALDRHAARQRHPQDDPGPSGHVRTDRQQRQRRQRPQAGCAAGSFALTGNAATLTKSLLATTSTAAPLPSMSMNFAVDPTHKFVLGSTGTFNVTGVAMVFRTGHGLVCDSGSFLVQGAPALRDFEYVGAKGSFAVTGNPIQMIRTRPAFVAATGAFLVSGRSAGLVYQQPAHNTIAAALAIFTVSGRAAGLVLQRKIVANNAVFLLSGRAAGLLYGRPVAAAKGSFALTGRAATIKATRILASATGAFLVVARDAAMSYGRSLAAQKGSFAVVGKSAGLVYQQPPQSRTVFGALGSFNVTGNAANFLHGYRISAAPAAFVVTGKVAAFTVPALAAVVVGARGVFTLTGKDAQLLYSAAPVVFDAKGGSPVYGGGRARGQAATAYRGGGTSGSAWAEIELAQEKTRRERAERQVARLTAKLQKQAKAEPAAVGSSSRTDRRSACAGGQRRGARHGAAGRDARTHTRRSRRA
jgi:hypothetical protein